MKTSIYCIQLQIFMEQNKSQNAIFLRDQTDSSEMFV